MANPSQPSFLDLAWNSLRRRVKLVPAWCVLSAVAAYLVSQSLGRDTWQARGALRLDGSPIYADGQTIYTPANHHSIARMMASPPLLEAAARDAGVSASGDDLARVVETDVPANSQLILLSLRWGDRDEAARLVAAVLDRSVSEQDQVRAEQIESAANRMRDGIRSARLEGDALMKQIREALGDSTSDDPVADLSRLALRIESLESEAWQNRRQEKAVEQHLRNLKERKERESAINPGRLTDVEETRQLELRKAQSDLKAAREGLRLYEQKRQRMMPLVRDRIYTPDELEAILEKMADLEARVRTNEAIIESFGRESSTPERSPLDQMLLEADLELSQLRVKAGETENALESAKAERAALEDLTSSSGSLIREAERLRRSVDERETALSRLLTMRESPAPELRIATPAFATDAPVSSSHRKWMLGVFGMSVTGLLVGLIGWDLWRASGSLRFMAWRLGLPVLADFTSGPEDPRLPEARLARTRGLALRLCQRVPEPGGLVLFAPLSKGVRLDVLSAELGAYLARHEERVLIIDVAITTASGWHGMIHELAEDGHVSIFDTPGPDGDSSDPEAALLDRTPEAEVEVLSVSGTRLNGPTALAEISRTGMSGCLDPRRQPSEFVFSTQIPAVDYLPVGHMSMLGGVTTLNRLREVINQMRDRYTLILMTAPPTRPGGVEQEVLAAFAQAVVLVGPVRPDSFAGVAQVVESMRAAALPLIGAVIGTPDGEGSAGAVEPASPAEAGRDDPGANGSPNWAVRAR